MAKKKVAKKKKAKRPPPKAVPLPVDDTADLMADGANPREISDEGAAGLRNSIKRFGDLSGIVWNKRTGELVCGHQRMIQIRAEYGDHSIEVLDAASELGVIRVDDKHAFTVRVVDWSQAKQRTANVAANNQKTQGKFTDDLSSFLLEIEPDISAELPGALDDLLIVPLLDVDIPEDIQNADTGMGFQVVVDCNDHAQQEELQKLLIKKGYKCRALAE